MKFSTLFLMLFSQTADTWSPAQTTTINDNGTFTRGIPTFYKLIKHLLVLPFLFLCFSNIYGQNLITSTYPGAGWSGGDDNDPSGTVNAPTSTACEQWLAFDGVAGNNDSQQGGAAIGALRNETITYTFTAGELVPGNDYIIYYEQANPGLHDCTNPLSGTGRWRFDLGGSGNINGTSVPAGTTGAAMEWSKASVTVTAGASLTLTIEARRVGAGNQPYMMIDNIIMVAAPADACEFVNLGSAALNECYGLPLVEVCYPETDGCALLRPGSQTGNHASCNITYEEPDPAVIVDVPEFDCDDPNIIAVTFDTPELPSSSSVLYHYWGNCAPLSPPMPEDFDPNNNGYIQQMFCDVDAFGLPAFPGGLSGETGTIGFLPKSSEDVGCFGFVEDVANSCLCGGGNSAVDGVEHTASELIQLDFWMAIPENQPQVGFRFSLDNREDAAAFFVGANLNEMCEVAYFTDGMNFGALTDEPVGTYNIAAGQLNGSCGLSWLRVRVYINDIAHAFRVTPQINAGNGWVDIDQLLIEPALSADDNVVPSVTLTNVEGYQIDGEFVYNDGGTWAPYGCNPVAIATGEDTGICNDTPTPVELLSFNATLNDEQVSLVWKTASEENNEGFEIQKSSNGQDWEVLTWVKGNGTTSEINTYNYLDRAPYIGDNYYRLKQIDYDGQFEFSDIIILKYDAPVLFVEVSPNPSPGDVGITVFNPNKEKMAIKLYDSTGLLIWKSDALTNLDIWKKQFNLVQKEMYFVSVQIGKEVFTEKILIIGNK